MFQMLAINLRFPTLSFNKTKDDEGNTAQDTTGKVDISNTDKNGFNLLTHMYRKPVPVLIR